MISFVYLDVGGVVIRDFSANDCWTDLLSELGIAERNKPAFDRIWEAHSELVCTTFDVDSLLPILKQQLGLMLPDDYSLLRGFVTRFRKNTTIWPSIDEIHRHVPVGLLTNMYPRMMAEILSVGILPDVEWDVVIDSSREGIQKPSSEIFRLAETKARARAEEILFVDNSKGHLDAAAACGWQVFLYDSADPQSASEQLLAYFNGHRS